MAGKIKEFQGQYRFLSNFYPAKVVYDGLEYPSTEHAFQAAKSLVESERVAIQKAPSASLAKAMGRNVKLRTDWDKVKINVMYNINFQKFQDPVLKEQILATGEKELIEGNSWGDVTWGVCDGKGKNYLGIILMKIRQQLRDQQEKSQ